MDSTDPICTDPDKYVTVFENGSVRVLEYRDVPGGAQIKVQWKGDNCVQGTEVIDFLIQMGAIRDFDPVGSPVSYVNSQGQSVHTVSFTLRGKG